MVAAEVVAADAGIVVAAGDVVVADEGGPAAAGFASRDVVGVAELALVVAVAAVGVAVADFAFKAGVTLVFEVSTRAVATPLTVLAVAAAAAVRRAVDVPFVMGRTAEGGADDGRFAAFAGAGFAAFASLTGLLAFTTLTGFTGLAPAFAEPEEAERDWTRAVLSRTERGIGFRGTTAEGGSVFRGAGTGSTNAFDPSIRGGARRGPQARDRRHNHG